MIRTPPGIDYPGPHDLDRPDAFRTLARAGRPEDTVRTIGTQKGSLS